MREFKTIPISFDPFYHNYNITSVIDYIKIFVSTKPFTLSRYIQPEIDLQSIRTAGFDAENRGIIKRAPQQALEDWTAFTIPIYLKRECDFPIQVENNPSS